MEIEISERLDYLSDVRLEGGEEGFESAAEELSREELTGLLGEAIDALYDAHTQHEREMRKLAERLQR